jgi:hypothetical protein
MQWRADNNGWRYIASRHSGAQGIAGQCSSTAQTRNRIVAHGGAYAERHQHWAGRKPLRSIVEGPGQHRRPPQYLRWSWRCRAGAADGAWRQPGAGQGRQRRQEQKQERGQEAQEEHRQRREKANKERPTGRELIYDDNHYPVKRHARSDRPPGPSGPGRTCGRPARATRSTGPSRRRR